MGPVAQRGRELGCLLAESVWIQDVISGNAASDPVNCVVAYTYFISVVISGMSWV